MGDRYYVYENPKGDEEVHIKIIATKSRELSYRRFTKPFSGALKCFMS